MRCWAWKFLVLKIAWLYMLSVLGVNVGCCVVRSVFGIVVEAVSHLEHVSHLTLLLAIQFR